MLVNIKNLHSDSFTIEIHENESVKDLKDKIAEKDDLREKYTTELLKLLYKGKVMDDDDTISSFGIEEDKYLVLVKQTPGKPPPKKKQPKPGFNSAFGGFNSMSQMSGSFMQNPFQQSPFMAQPFQSNSFSPEAFQSNSFSPQPFQQTALPQQSNFPAAQPSSGLEGVSSDAFSTAEDREEALQTLLAMGFEKKESERALQASFYNVQAAIELITSGTVPVGETNVGLTQVNPPNIFPSSPTTRHRTGAAGMGSNMKQMSEMLKRNPEQLQAIKQQMQAEHPEIAQMIDDDPQAFLALLDQAGDASGADNFGASHGGGGGQMNLSPNDQKTITRLEEIGFERNRAIEAFLLCERNEEQTINYLLNSAD